MSVYQEWQTAILVFGVVLGTLLVGLAVRAIVDRLGRRVSPTRHVWTHSLVSSASAPAQAAIWIVGVAAAVHVLLDVREGAGDSMLTEVIGPARDVAIITVAMWFLLRVSARVQENMMIRARSRGQELDPTAADAVGKLARASIVITAILMMMQTLGFSIAGLLAFGGVGGIAVGFAAQSLVANLLGGLTIFASRPFKVGEYVIIPGTELMGCVEHIGWRATRLLGFDCKPFYVPNAMFNSEPVINHTRMTARRIMEDIHIRYSDIDAVPAIVTDVRAMLAQHPGVKHDFFAFNFNSYGNFSLKLFLYAFTVSTDYNEYLNVQEDVLLKIAAIIRRHGAELTGPASRVDVPQWEGAALDRMPPGISNQPLPPQPSPA